MVAPRHCGVMVELQGLSAWCEYLKVGGSNPLLGNTTTKGIFWLHPAVAWYFARLFITKRWLAFIHRTLKIQNAKFSTFWCFPPSAQNSWREPWLAQQHAISGNTDGWGMSSVENRLSSKYCRKMVLARAILISACFVISNSTDYAKTSSHAEVSTSYNADK